MILVVLFGVSVGFACVIDPKDTTIINNGGQGGQGGAGMNTMTGGSADRPDAAFKFFVSQERLQEISSRNEKARAEEEAKIRAESERKSKIEALQKQIDELKK